MVQGRFSVFPHENFVDLFLVQYGWEQCIPLHSYGPHIRNNYLFHYVISGRGWLEVRQNDGTVKKYQIHGGQGFLICPNQVTTYCADEIDPWTYTSVSGGVRRCAGPVPADTGRTGGGSADLHPHPARYGQ